MRARSRWLGAVVLSTVGFMAVRAEPVRSIRVNDRGPFRVWNGLDGDAPRSSGQRVLAVIGATKSIRVTYAATMASPRVTMEHGYAEIVPGPGTTIDFGGPARDCHSNQILFCTNTPINGYPPGTIVCMCTKEPGSMCCSSDTGFVPPTGMIPIDSEL